VNQIADDIVHFVQVMNPGLLGGLLLPILGAFPDSILILVSGVGGSVQQVMFRVLNYSLRVVECAFATHMDYVNISPY